MKEEPPTVQEDFYYFKDTKVLAELKKETQEYIDSVKQNIMDSNDGKIPAIYTAQLKQLRDLYLAYLKTSYYMDDQDTVVKYSNKVFGVNQLLTVQIRLSQTINSLVKNFGLSPADREALKFKKGKAKKIVSDVEVKEEVPDFMDDF
jgi:hypothetical protein